jgi:hypothetical protein
MEAEQPASQSAILVEVFLSELRLTGSYVAGTGDGRFSDMLNGPGEALELTDVTVRSLTGATLETCAEARIPKKQISFALPMEPSNQLSQRKAMRFGVLTPVMNHLAVSLVLPPFLIQGQIAADHRARLPQFAQLPGFFPVLNASVRSEGAEVSAAAVFLVNKDAVMCLGTNVAPLSAVVTPAPVHGGDALSALFAAASRPREDWRVGGAEAA